MTPGMAAFQESYKWIAAFLCLFATGLLQCVLGCSPTSKELHICLNIYLERDFSLIETIMNGQKESVNNGRRVIVEPMDLEDTCNHITSLYNCYWTLLPECDSLWKYDRYMRVMDVLNATRTHLCSGYKNNLKDLILKSGCLIRARSHISSCKGFDWMMTWRHVLRMKVSPSDTCSELQTYWECLEDRMNDIACGPQTTEVYQKLIDVWLQHWCAKNLPHDEEKKYFYMVADKSEEAANEALKEIERHADLNRIA